VGIAQAPTRSRVGSTGKESARPRSNRALEMSRMIRSRFALTAAPTIVVTRATSPSVALNPSHAPTRAPPAAAAKPVALVVADKSHLDQVAVSSSNWHRLARNADEFLISNRTDCLVFLSTGWCRGYRQEDDSVLQALYIPSVWKVQAVVKVASRAE
jgi:hypothetical protein